MPEQVKLSPEAVSDRNIDLYQDLKVADHGQEFATKALADLARFHHSEDVHEGTGGEEDDTWEWSQAAARKVTEAHKDAKDFYDENAEQIQTEALEEASQHEAK